MFRREYELMYIAKPELEEAIYEQIGDKLAAVLDQSDGTRLHLDVYGRRKLAYDIDDFSKGVYYLLNFLGDAATVSALERSLRFDENVLRHMTVKISDRVEVEVRKALAEREEAERAARRAVEEESARKAAEEREYWERQARPADGHLGSDGDDDDPDSERLGRNLDDDDDDDDDEADDD